MFTLAEVDSFIIQNTGLPLGLIGRNSHCKASESPTIMQAESLSACIVTPSHSSGSSSKLKNSPHEESIMLSAIVIHINLFMTNRF